MKHKSYRERYFEDMEAVRVPANNRKGYRVEYKYVGFWKAWEREGVDLKLLRFFLAVMEAAAALLYLVSAMAKVGLNDYGIAGGFGTISIVAWILEMSGVARFCAAGEFVREQSWHEIDKSIRYGCCARAILLGLSLLCALVQTIPTGFTSGDALAAAGLLASILLSLAVYLQYTRLWEATYRNRDGGVGTRY